MKTLHGLAMGMLCTLFIACGASSGQDLALDDEVQSLGEAVTPDNSTYYSIHRDLRRCAPPLCGGYFVRRVNRNYTICSDGAARRECYVLELDLRKLGQSSEADTILRRNSTAFLLRGNILRWTDRAPSDGVFVAKEAWRGHEGISPIGTFVRAQSSGIVCITFPCLSYKAAPLNSDRPSQLLAGVNIEGVGNDEDDAPAQIARPEGLLVAGSGTTVNGPAGTAPALVANEYYLPYTAQSSPCGSRGLAPCPSGTYCKFEPEKKCGRTNESGVCMPRPEICLEVYAPICGCDGKTYGNACKAASAGVSVDHTGECSGELHR